MDRLAPPTTLSCMGLEGDSGKSCAICIKLIVDNLLWYLFGTLNSLHCLLWYYVRVLEGICETIQCVAKSYVLLKLWDYL